MAGRYPVKIFHCQQRNAPTIDGTPGSFVNLLKKCLIEGFGEVSAISGEIVDGLCTIYLNGGESFEKNHIVLISGTNLAGINGEQRVEETTANSITFSTIEPNQVLIGSITVKYAPVGGWITPYTGTNEAVFKATHPESSGIYFHVDDTNALYATMRMFGYMTSVNTGGAEWPVLPAMGRIFTKSYQANTTARMWEFIADDFTCYYGVNRVRPPSERLTRPIAYHGFGDYIEEKTKSTGNAFIKAVHTSRNESTGADVNYQLSAGIGYDSTAYSDLVVYRNLETGVPQTRYINIESPIRHSNFSSGRDFPNGAYNNLNKEVIVSRTTIYGYNNREFIPGWYIINNALPVSDFASKHWTTTDEIIGIENKLFLYISESSNGSNQIFYVSGNYKNSNHDSYSRFSCSLVDITGPWR